MMLMLREETQKRLMMVSLEPILMKKMRERMKEKILMHDLLYIHTHISKELQSNKVFPYANLDVYTTPHKKSHLELGAFQTGKYILIRKMSERQKIS